MFISEAHLSNTLKCAHTVLVVFLCNTNMFKHEVVIQAFSSYVLNSFAQESLWILDISNNNIDDVQDLAVLKELRHFSAVDNKLHNMEVGVSP